jgi:hypothetical protein
MSKLKRGNWSTYELERLRALYPKSTDEHVSRLLHRSVASVNRKARDIFGCDQTERPWTAGDDLRLREGYGVLTISVLCLVLGRPAHDVEARIDSFKGLARAGKWTRTELGYSSESMDHALMRTWWSVFRVVWKTFETPPRACIFLRIRASSPGRTFTASRCHDGVRMKSPCYGMAIRASRILY